MEWIEVDYLNSVLEVLQDVNANSLPENDTECVTFIQEHVYDGHNAWIENEFFRYELIRLTDNQTQVQRGKNEEPMKVKKIVVDLAKFIPRLRESMMNGVTELGETNTNRESDG